MGLEKNIAKYVKSKGITLTVMAKQTGIAYMALYDSLINERRKRKLRSNELIVICKFLEKKPDDFIDKLTA